MNRDGQGQMDEKQQEVNSERLMETDENGFLTQYIRRELLKEGAKPVIETYREIDSTSTLLWRYAQAGEQRDMVVLAGEQSRGRGRRGRSFYSPEKTGLYMSLLLHLHTSPQEAAMLTTLAAVATVQALEEVSQREVWIKWVNDILIDGKKVVGILTEASPVGSDGSLSYAIVGIGINLYEPEEGFPEELSEIAGTVFGRAERSKELPSRIAAGVLRSFMQYYRSFPEGAYLEEYRRHSCVLGKRIRILTPSEADRSAARTKEAPVYATALDIDENCHLKVRYDDGRVEYLSNGEVSIRL